MNTNFRDADEVHPLGEDATLRECAAGESSGGVAPPCRNHPAASSRLAGQLASRTLGSIQLRFLG